MITANFTVSPQTGNVYVTDHTFTDLTTSTNTIVNRIWDFGDSILAYNQTSLTHAYDYPGIYTVTLTATDLDGNGSITTQTLTATYLYRDSVTISQVPEDYPDPGKVTSVPFKLKVFSTQISSTPVLDLFVTNSNSIPYDAIPEKWRFLTPTWKFLDKNFNYVTSLSVETKLVYFNSRVAAISGEAEFYYVDSQSVGSSETNCPLVITATLQTSGFNYPVDSKVYPYPSYANNVTPRAALVWQVNDFLPDTIKITENYLTDIYPKKWKDVKIPFLLTYHNSKSTSIPGADSYGMSEILFAYPENNTLGRLLSVSVALSGTNKYTVDEAPLYFQALDSQGSPTGGYIFTTVTPTSTISSTCVQASSINYTNITAPSGQFVYPKGYAPNTFIWICNTSINSLSRILIETYPNTCPTINYYKNNGLLFDGYIKTVENLTTSTDPSLSYSSAVDPRNKELITTDASLDRLYKLSSNGTLLSSLQLSSINSAFSLASGITPAHLSLDSNFNIYLTLFNATSVLKFDKNFNLQTTFTYNTAYNYRPPVVETDRSSNAWITYTSNLSSSLLKYSSAGTQLLNITLSPSSVPVSLVTTQENNIWVANSYNQLLSGGTLQLYNSSGTLLSTISSYTHPTSLAVDRTNGLWLTHGRRNIGYVSPQGTSYSWTVSTNGTFPTQTVTSPSVLSAVYNQKELGGLTVDVYNRVWVIDAITSRVYIISATPAFTTGDIRTVSITPNYNVILDTSVNPLTGEYFKPFQANGDWTGNRWYQKYYNPNTLSAISLSGVSTSFKVQPLENPSQIYRVNENFNNAEYYKSLALPESLYQNTNLFDNFFAAAVGTSTPSAYQDIGQTVYERIANFVYNHTDIDTCNIDQLVSQANETYTPANIYSLQYPADIQKYLDISSVSKNKLWGLKSPIALSSQSIGSQLNTQTSYVTAGTKIYLQSKLDSKYTLYTVPLLSTQTIYPLSALEGIGFAQPIIVNYFFFSFDPVYSNNFIENFIDWSNPNTTLNPYMSSTQEWYGGSGAIETAFNYLLTKNLTVK